MFLNWLRLICLCLISSGRVFQTLVTLMKYERCKVWLPLYRPVLIWWCPGHQHLSALSILGTNSLVFNTTIAFFHAACGSIRLQVLLIALATLYWRSPNGRNIYFFIKGRVRSLLYTPFHPHLSFRVQVWSILWILLTSGIFIRLYIYIYTAVCKNFEPLIYISIWEGFH